MRDLRNHRFEDGNFATEKVMATIYLIMFVLIVGMGVHTQFLRTAPDAAGSAAVQTTLR